MQSSRLKLQEAFNGLNCSYFKSHRQGFEHSVDSVSICFLRESILLHELYSLWGQSIKSDNPVLLVLPVQKGHCLV